MKALVTQRITLKIVGFKAKDSQERGTSLIIKEAREIQNKENSRKRYERSLMIYKRMATFLSYHPSSTLMAE